MCAELEKWSLEERQAGRQAGLQAGRQEGRQEGENRLTTLLKLLKADDRLQDLELAIDIVFIELGMITQPFTF